MSKWPRDNQDELIRFYGNPGSSGPNGVAAQLTRVTPPFKMYYEGQRVASLSFHRKAAPALLAALTKAWEYYGRDQAKIDALGISKTAGTYNPRKIRGSATKWSNHAFGAAIDVNAEDNGFNVEGNIPPVLIAAFKSEGARWGGDYTGRTDPMHFEFCQGRDPTMTFEQWLEHYGVPQVDSPPVAVADTKGIEIASGDDEETTGADDGEGEDEVVPGSKPRMVPEKATITAKDTLTGETTTVSAKAAALAPGVYYTVKSAFKSKMSWFTGGLGTASATTAVGADPDTRSLLLQLLTKPLFWMAILCLVLATYIVYLRWREYGRGNPNNIIKANGH